MMNGAAATDTRPALTGISSESGECDRCGRELGRVFEVRHPDGTSATYGRRCAAAITGFTVTEAKLRQARRTAERTIVLAARSEQMRAAYPGEDEDFNHNPDWLYTLTADQLWRDGARWTWRQQYDKCLAGR